MKTQWPRSADEPGLYMAQTGNRARLPSSVAGARLGGVCWHVCSACAHLCLCPGVQSRLCHVGLWAGLGCPVEGLLLGVRVGGVP